MQGDSSRHNTPLAETQAWAERKLWRIFLGSLGLCALVVWQLCSAVRCASPYAAPLRTSLLPILLWGVVVTTYAFYTLWVIAQQRKDKLKELAQKDPVTEAFTAAYLEDELVKEKQRALTTGRLSAFAYVRFARLEPINTDYGFGVGNIVLKAMFEILKGGVPPQSVVARLGGQHFAVLFPEMTLQEADLILKGVPERTRAYSLDLGKRGHIGGLDASIGTAAFPSDGGSLQEIRKAARPKAGSGQGL